jgi:glycosyltransferase involved in cell wall biosynthesis
MRIIFNSLSALKPKTGVGHYAAHLLAGLREVLAGGAVYSFPRGWLKKAARFGQTVVANRAAAAGPTTARTTPVVWPRGLARQTGRLLRTLGRGCFQGGFTWACRRHQFDLYHEPNFIPWATDVPTVVTLHDLSVIRYPQWHPADRVEYHERHFRRGLEQSAHCLTVSEFSRRELIRLMGVAPERVTAVHNGIGDQYCPLPPEEVAVTRQKFGLPADYLLHVGTIEPRKNLLTLLQAYASLPPELRERHPLLLVGGWGWNAGAVREFLHEKGAAAGVRHIGYLPAEDLPAVYNGAQALVYPSYYEGFGLPPLEMMACGGAVLSSTAESLREVLPAGGCFIDPGDLDGWREALQRVLTDEDWRSSLRAGAEEFARQYSWTRCATETLAVYRMLARAA